MLGQHEPMENGAAPENKNPLEQAVDVFIYAPLGLVLEARAMMPRFVERGRQQIKMTRMIGKFAVRQGQKETTKVLGKAGEQASAVLADLGVLPRETNGVEPAPQAEPADSEPSPAAAPAPTKTTVAPRSDEGAIDLAIADFDSLAASQVIPRLPGLSSAELEAVRSYEAVHRGRKTVLNRIAQLQSA
jgi:hypothetical protein